MLVFADRVHLFDSFYVVLPLLLTYGSAMTSLS